MDTWILRKGNTYLNDSLVFVCNLCVDCFWILFSTCNYHEYKRLRVMLLMLIVQVLWFALTMVILLSSQDHLGSIIGLPVQMVKCSALSVPTYIYIYWLICHNIYCTFIGSFAIITRPCTMNQMANSDEPWILQQNSLRNPDRKKGSKNNLCYTFCSMSLLAGLKNHSHGLKMTFINPFGTCFTGKFIPKPCSISTLSRTHQYSERSLCMAPASSARSKGTVTERLISPHWQ